MAPKQRVIEAISSLRHRVTVADVSVRTGLALNEATLALNQIALETQGVLEVSEQGHILYRFKENLPSIYRTEGIKRAAEQVAKLAIETLYFLIRISFGLLLIASCLTLAVVFTIALVLILFGMEGADGDIDADNLDLDFDFFDILNLLVFFSWSARDSQSAQVHYLGQAIDIREKGFLFNCFSFLFGDGNPNSKAEEEKWHYVAELIRQNHGVVTTEQLAPYLGPNMEKAALSTLIRFVGYPEVTERGNIVYVFPSMQVTADTRQLPDLPDSLVEKPWKFSNTPTRRLHAVFFFAGANLAGWYCVLRHLTTLEFLQPYASIINLMYMYAIFFLGFPLLRQLFNIVRNAAIDIRNARRAAQHAELTNPNFKAKINEAQSFRPKHLELNGSQVVYTTEKDALEQQFGN